MILHIIYSSYNVFLSVFFKLYHFFVGTKREFVIFMPFYPSNNMAIYFKAPWDILV